MPAVGQMRLGLRMRFGRGLRLRLDMGLWLTRCAFLTWCAFKDNRNLWLQGRRRLQKWSNKIVLALRFDFEQKGFTSRRRFLLSRNWLGLGMAAAHDALVKALFDHLARGGFQYHLMAQDCRAIGLFPKICLDALCFLAGQQTQSERPCANFRRSQLWSTSANGTFHS